MVGQWVIERARAFDAGMGQRWSKQEYGKLADNATVLCYIGCVHDTYSFIYAPDDPAPLKITNINVRRRRLSSITETKTAEGMSKAAQAMDLVEPPTSLNDIPWPDPRKRDKQALLNAIQSILRSRKKQQKPTDSREVHLDYSSFLGLVEPQHRGHLSKIRTIYPRIEIFDANYMHSYGYIETVQYMQILTYRSAEELERLGAWLGQPNFNMHRRGNRPKELRPEPVFFDEMNVVHPKLIRTHIVIKYNVSTFMAKITISYQKVGPIAPGQESHFLPSGSCDPPTVPVDEPLSEDVPRCAPADEYTDAVLQDEQVEIGEGVYKITDVGSTCTLQLVAGTGPSPHHASRIEAIRLIAVALGFDPPP